jgi:hypothetical protein
MAAPATAVERELRSQSTPASVSLQLSRGPLLPGAYAWLSTVLLPVQSLNGAWPVRTLAWASVVTLLLAELPLMNRFRSLRGVACVAFIAGCLTTWILLAEQLRAVPVDAIQAAVGGIGWVLFALSVQSDPRVPESDLSRLQPVASSRRRRFSPSLDVAFLVLVLAGLLPLFLAWRVERAMHAALAQVVACAAALAGLSLAGSLVDAAALRRNFSQTRARWADSWSTLAMLALLLVAGLVLKLF